MRCFVMSPNQDFAAVEIDFLKDDALAVDLYLADIRRLAATDTAHIAPKAAKGSRWRRLMDKVSGLGMPPAHQLDIY